MVLHLTGRWIGRDGPITEPPRSPDITPLDLQDLRTWITDVIRTILQTCYSILGRKLTADWKFFEPPVGLNIEVI